MKQPELEVLKNLRREINAVFLQDESESVESLLVSAKNDHLVEHNIEFRARDLVDHVRENIKKQDTIEAFIREYSLSSEEGVVLMCLAEALLRIPDTKTADRLIRDKIAPAEWHKHKGVSRSLFVNASTWGLMLTGRLVGLGNSSTEKMDVFSGLVSRLGEPVVRTVIRQAMKLMGSQYVMGTSIEAAVERSESGFHKNVCFSFDMLGEAALSSKDAAVYLQAYEQAIFYLGRQRKAGDSLYDAASISIKLSALHPRYEFSQERRVLDELVPKVLHLAELAKSQHIALTLDAEEADRLDLSLDIFQAVKLSDNIKNWDGFGLAVQAYQKRAYTVLKYLLEVSKLSASKIPVRLVKGAYWDTEIKRAQELGLKSYPVFTRKACTDVSYLACAKLLLQHEENFYPQFATHNAHTLAAVFELANNNQQYEFQRLHGMGESLYTSLLDQVRCRIYAPVGSYKDLLPYLVRRLLENGANSSFVNRIENEAVPVDHIVKSPVEKVEEFDFIPNTHIPVPFDLFQGQRKNSIGVNFSDSEVIEKLIVKIESFRDYQWSTEPFFKDTNRAINILNPADKNHIVGQVNVADKEEAQQILLMALKNREKWKNTNVEIRINYIKKLADLLQENAHELYALAVFEAGKTIKDVVSELREAIDFCYYYVAQAEKMLSQEDVLPGPTGEKNIYQLHGRGVFVCISPWNFPIAIFTGQIVAALLTGNVVIAKPSANTSLIASKIIDLMYLAGIPKESLYFLPCSGSVLSEEVLTNKGIDGVVFTGSFDVASSINQTLMLRAAHIVPLIAETGGLNAMIVDSSALPEQVVKDVITSAFNSAGQRCSALRILILQKDIYDSMLELLKEAMKELVIGDPSKMNTDIPPVIDKNAKLKLDEYKQKLTEAGKLIFELPLDSKMEKLGNFVSPAIYKIDVLTELGEEQFGPILHIMSFESDGLNDIVEDLNTLGYGLTLGVHSRINETIDCITTNANVGNLYVNRNMVGAVVGVQPFGGEGLSGTGPKAGGPNYLQRFCTEKTISVNTVAVGGNASLLALNDD